MVNQQILITRGLLPLTSVANAFWEQKTETNVNIPKLRYLLKFLSKIFLQEDFGLLRFLYKLYVEPIDWKIEH